MAAPIMYCPFCKKDVKTFWEFSEEGFVKCIGSTRGGAGYHRKCPYCQNRLSVCEIRPDGEGGWDYVFLPKYKHGDPVP